MRSFRHLVIAAVLFSMLAIGISGCSLFDPQPKKPTRPVKEGPQTVEGWMKQDRVKP